MGQKHQLIFKGTVLGFGADGFEEFRLHPVKCGENKVMRLALAMGKLRHGERSNLWSLQQSQEANSGPSQGVFQKIHPSPLHPLPQGIFQIFDLQ